MKTKKDQPLPDHTKLDYYECYAKIVLEESFSYNNLLLDDKPDLQDVQNSIGIEVTIAEESKSLEAENLYSKLHYVDENTQRKHIDRINQCSATCENGVLFGFPRNDDFTLINEAIDCKIKKLKSAGYKRLNEYQLFIFSSIYAIDSMLQEELNYLLEKNIDTFFSKIYVLVPNAMFFFDLKEKKYKIFNVSSVCQDYRAQRARKMVQDGEKDE